MQDKFFFSEFKRRFPDEEACLEEIRKIRFRSGMYCMNCLAKTKHYKIRGRTAYSCKNCRNQIYPLAGTIFEKSSTPLRVWFYCMFLMTQTRATVTAKALQRELGVTYKTAWRMSRLIRSLMEQNNADLLKFPEEQSSVLRWTFFNKIQFTVVQKQEE